MLTKKERKIFTLGEKEGDEKKNRLRLIRIRTKGVKE